MSVAWIGSQAVSLTVAIQEAANLLSSSRCPVFSIDSDVNGNRSVIALAERVGGTYDHVLGEALVSEVALHTGTGGFFTTPLETRRRSDMIIIVGDIPNAHHDLIRGLAASSPDLPSSRKRHWFHLADNDTPSHNETTAILKKVKAVPLKMDDARVGAGIATLRAILAGKQVNAELTGIERFMKALATANFPVFIFSGNHQNAASLAMLQGMLGDLNKERRATSLYLPTDDGAWGLVLTSLWMTGFPPRTSFMSGLPVYDPWLCDVERMILEKEADLHVWISERGLATPRRKAGVSLIVLAPTGQPSPGAAVTLPIGQAGTDHDGIFYSSVVGTLRGKEANSSTSTPTVSGIMRQLSSMLLNPQVLAC